MKEIITLYQFRLKRWDRVTYAGQTIEVVQMSQHAHTPVQIPHPNLRSDHEQQARVENECGRLPTLRATDEASAEQVLECAHTSACTCPAERNSMLTHHVGYLSESRSLGELLRYVGDLGDAC